MTWLACVLLRKIKAGAPAADGADSEELSKVPMETDPKAGKGPSVEDLFSAFDEGLEDWGVRAAQFMPCPQC